MLKILKLLLQHPLNAKGRTAALTRFLRWQIGVRLLPVPHLMPFVGDTCLVMERGMTGATGNWYCGLHEASDMAFVLHVLRDGDLFVDIGANVGSYTVLASGAVGARSIAFEPVPETYAMLTRNLSANRITDLVVAHNLGLGARNEKLRFTAGHDTTNHVVIGTTDTPTLEVTVRRLDEMLDSEVPRVIKLDVEGWEGEVLKGMSATLANPALAAVVCETNESAGRYTDVDGEYVEQVMRMHGFAAHSYNPENRELVRGGTGENTIFVRDYDFLCHRIATAPRFRLVNGTI
ncbi:FkbM family methyltransferase [Psychromarinibacter sp. C21-152]|uniref:FkbM family methyltransferase n=1 Tax=Psychromarinibacter sediminicola TaxID=3033385 RepID=A0AAE3NWY4_9RHOB|nr:FkbM family methyltransferase [Psychromarinibacter sediminicola]MDF0603754.1 FkbM family methyltransferase [Psychromarinibacter sediminicola]